MNAAKVLNDAAVILANLAAEVRRSRIWIVAKSVAHSLLRHKDQELVIGHVQAELALDIIVPLRGFIAGPTCAVEGFSRVDTRGGHVAAVLTRERVAGSAFGGHRAGKSHRGRSDEDRQCREVHDD